MQLTDSLGQVLGTGMGGIVLTIARWAKWGIPTGIGLTFGMTILICVAGALLTPRMDAPETSLPSRRKELALS
jgi:hypothetical protein